MPLTKIKEYLNGIDGFEAHDFKKDIILLTNKGTTYRLGFKNNRTNIQIKSMYIGNTSGIKLKKIPTSFLNPKNFLYVVQTDEYGEIENTHELLNIVDYLDKELFRLYELENDLDKDLTLYEKMWKVFELLSNNSNTKGEISYDSETNVFYYTLAKNLYFTVTEENKLNVVMYGTSFTFLGEALTVKNIIELMERSFFIFFERWEGISQNTMYTVNDFMIDISESNNLTQEQKHILYLEILNSLKPQDTYLNCKILLNLQKSIVFENKGFHIVNSNSKKINDSVKQSELISYIKNEKFK